MSLRFVCYSIDITDEFKSLSNDEKLKLVRYGNDCISDFMSNNEKCILLCGNMKDDVFILNLSGDTIEFTDEEYNKAVFDSSCFKLLDIIEKGVIEDGDMYSDVVKDKSIHSVRDLLKSVEVPTDNKIKLLKAYNSLFGDATANSGIRTDYIAVATM